MKRAQWLTTAMVATLVAACSAGGTPTPAPVVATPVPTPSVAGPHTTMTFRPPISYTLPEGWLIASDAADYFAIRPATTEILGIHVFRSPRAASQDAACPVTPAAGVGSSASDLVAWIRARPGLVVSDPTPVTIGGLAGQQLDLAIIGGWNASCPFANGSPTVPLFVGATGSSFRWVVADAERLRLAILDVPGSGTVVVDIDDFLGTQIDSLISEATPIAAGFKFGLP